MQPKGESNLTVEMFQEFVNRRLHLHNAHKAAKAAACVPTASDESMHEETKQSPRESVSLSTARRMLLRFGYRYKLVKRCVAS